MEAQYFMIAGAFLICLPFINVRMPFLLRNMFIAYTFAIYNLAPLVFFADQNEIYQWSLEFILVLLLFMGGYSIGMRWARRSIQSLAISRPEAAGRDGIWQPVLLTLFCATGVLIIRDIVSYGMVEYYSGLKLVATIQDYGKLNARGALDQILNFVVSTITIVCLATFVERVNAQRGVSVDPVRHNLKKRTVLRLCAIWLIVFPILQFSRAGLFYGSITYLAIRTQLIKNVFTLKFIALMGLALLFFVYVGLVRDQRLGGTARVNSLFTSELAPWTAYRDIKENMDKLGYQHGNTLFLPFVLKVIPRGLYPDKVQNSAGYYMSVLYPDQFNAGFVVAPTYMGDLYLNFGICGVCVCTIIFGVLSGRVDGILIYQHLQWFGIFIIVFACYISLLRDSLSNAMFNLMVAIVLYLFVSKWPSPRSSNTPMRQYSGTQSS